MVAITETPLAKCLEGWSTDHRQVRCYVASDVAEKLKATKRTLPGLQRPLHFEPTDMSAGAHQA